MGYARRLLLLFPLSLLSSLPALAQGVAISYTHVTLSSLLDGGRVASATLCATPADQYGNPISFSSAAVGLVMKGALFCGTVTAGSLNGSLGVPNACATNNTAPIFYNFTIQEIDPSGNPTGVPVVITAVPNVCGVGFALDSYSPTAATNIPLSPPLAQGAGVPSICTAPSMWVDTTAPALYFCKGGTYVVVSTQGIPGPNNSTVAVATQTSTYMVPSSTGASLVRCNGSFTVTLPASPAAGQVVYVKNVGTSPVTISGNGALIDGSSTYTLPSSASAGVQPSMTLVYDVSTTSWSIL